jgi:hypothetical protein
MTKKLSKKNIFSWLTILAITTFIVGFFRSQSFIITIIGSKTYTISTIHLSFVLSLHVLTCMIIYFLINHERLVSWMISFHLINTSIAFVLMIGISLISPADMVGQRSISNIFIAGFTIAIAAFLIFCFNVSFSFLRKKSI